MKNRRRFLSLFLALCLLALCTPALASTNELVMNVDLDNPTIKKQIAQSIHISENVTNEKLVEGVKGLVKTADISGFYDSSDKYFRQKVENCIYTRKKSGDEAIVAFSLHIKDMAPSQADQAVKVVNMGLSYPNQNGQLAQYENQADVDSVYRQLELLAQNGNGFESESTGGEDNKVETLTDRTQGSLAYMRKNLLEYSTGDEENIIPMLNYNVILVFDNVSNSKQNDLKPRLNMTNTYSDANKASILLDALHQIVQRLAVANNYMPENKAETSTSTAEVAEEIPQ